MSDALARVIAETLAHAAAYEARHGSLKGYGLVVVKVRRRRPAAKKPALAIAPTAQPVNPFDRIDKGNRPSLGSVGMEADDCPCPIRAGLPG